MAPPEASEQSSSKSLQCSYCPKAFGRPEHLRRHELIHTKKTTFNCSVCSKEFTRRDALQRHLTTHQVTSPSLLSKGARACIACATAKVRCTGEQQCIRCAQRGNVCTYPEVPGQEVPNGGHAGNGSYTTMPSDPGALQPYQMDDQRYLFDATPTQPSMSFDPDIWDPSILSTSNWLDAVVDFDYQPYPVLSPHFGSYQLANIPPTSSPLYVHGISGRPSTHPGQYQEQNLASSPVAVASVNSGQSGLSTSSAANVCAEQEESESRKGEYYVDGEPSRLPRTKRRKLSSKITTLSPLQASQSSLSLQSPTNNISDLKHRIAIPPNVYEKLLRSWQTVCLSEQGLWPAFEASEFPPQDLFEHLLGLYFASFQVTLPFLHPATFQPDNTHWILILAITAIGARYFGTHPTPALIDSLQEFLRRCLVYQEEAPTWAPIDDLSLSQTRILSLIGMLYSGNPRLTKLGLNMQHLLASSHATLVQDTNTQIPSGDAGIWSMWARTESIKRTLYSLFLVDNMLAYHFQRSATIFLDDCHVGLPCHERLWTASRFSDWQAESAKQSTEPSLQKALQEIYVEKWLPRERGEFARIIMIHGLFSRSWESERYLSNPLSQWEPTAKKESSADVLPSAPIWPPSVNTHKNLQNSACDCLDILHWQANSTIGQASGLEHPTVAFLHLSRVILLTPINSIVSLAKAKANGTAPLPKEINFIQRWATQGQFKARLSAIHAGTVFWHIRRYSVDGFYEAPAVALAALTLWAFGTFSVKSTAIAKPQQKAMENCGAEVPQGTSNESEEGGGDDTICGIILLDRPTDDELVQQFIRKGHMMRANITGVGDLYGPRGPERVLQEGCKLLNALNRWGVSAPWLELLDTLSKTCKK